MPIVYKIEESIKNEILSIEDWNDYIVIINAGETTGVYIEKRFLQDIIDKLNYINEKD